MRELGFAFATRREMQAGIQKTDACPKGGRGKVKTLSQSVIIMFVKVGKTLLAKCKFWPICFYDIQRNTAIACWIDG